MLDPWTTAPHGINFSAAAKMFGLHYNSPTIRGGLADNLGEALQRAEKSNRSTLIEVQTNRIENVQFHRTLQGEIVAALDRSRIGTNTTTVVSNP
jgi:2-succinyl-5-enolpyruvyl-6-hydroxy-3-cyclohexene-1-carboxylate synthase